MLATKMQTDARLNDLSVWLHQVTPSPIIKIIPLAGDASFRRYFRVVTQAQTFMAMDSPPDKEDCRPFIGVAECFNAHQLPVPTIFAKDIQSGFLLLADFGDNIYLPLLNADTAAKLYTLAFKHLLTLQTILQHQHYSFRAFDRSDFLRELTHFREWFLLKHLELDLSPDDESQLTNSFDFLITEALAQPQVCVHRDYHSRNLMLQTSGELGILDFQDAVWGPVSYDLVSLLRDCYIAWPEQQVYAWVKQYYELARHTPALKQYSLAQFTRGFDLAGLQRHLKCMFIFARKFRRDGTTAYLNDIPRILKYSIEISRKYHELSWLENFLTERVAVRLEQL